MNGKDRRHDRADEAEILARLIEAELADEEEDAPLSPAEAEASYERVRRRLGLVEDDQADNHASAEEVLTFVADIEAWLADVTGAALVRGVTAVARTLSLEAPTLTRFELSPLVEIEADIEPDTRLADLTVHLDGAGTARDWEIRLTARGGVTRTARLSRFGLARFSSVPLDLAEGASLEFTIRPLGSPTSEG